MASTGARLAEQIENLSAFLKNERNPHRLVQVEGMLSDASTYLQEAGLVITGRIDDQAIQENTFTNAERILHHFQELGIDPFAVPDATDTSDIFTK